MLTLEKVMMLKSISVFSDIADRTLIEVASVLEEAHFDADQTIFKKGDTGHSLYLVVEGAVRIHDGDKTIATLGPGEVFGELAALDPEPRMASATTTEPVLLLHMDHAELNELMAEHPEVAPGIIRGLCRRLRKD